MNIRELHEKFCEDQLYIAENVPGSVRLHRITFDLFQRLLPAHIESINDITREHIRRFLLAGKKERKWSRHTSRGNQKRLRTFFRWAIAEKIIEENPLAGFPLIKLLPVDRKSISAEEGLYVMNTAASLPYHHPLLPLRNPAIIATILFAGLRSQEVCDLDCADIDLENSRLYVRHGKGGKSRSVAINPRLKMILRRYKEARIRFKITCPKFFVLCREDKGISTDTLRKLNRILRKATNIDFTLHGLRHTFATLMVEGGCNLDSLRQMLGHERLSTTGGYVNTAPDTQHYEVRKHPMTNM